MNFKNGRPSAFLGYIEIMLGNHLCLALPVKIQKSCGNPKLGHPTRLLYTIHFTWLSSLAAVSVLYFFLDSLATLREVFWGLCKGFLRCMKVLVNVKVFVVCEGFGGYEGFKVAGIFWGV